MGGAGEVRTHGGCAPVQRWRRLRVVLALLSAFLCLCAGARGLYAQDAKEELARITGEVTRGETRLEEVIARQGKIERELKGIRISIDRLREEEARLSSLLVQSEAEAAELDQRFLELEAEISAVQRRSLRRLRAMYLEGEGSLLDHLLNVSTSNDLIDRAYLLSRIRRYDETLMTQLAELQREESERRRELDGVRTEQRRLQAKLTRERSSLRTALYDQERMVTNLQAERRKIDTEVTALKAQALRLETVMVSMLGGEDPAPRRSAASRAAPRPASVAAFDGPGLARLRGRLPLPVAGSIVRAFGRVTGAGFRDFVFSKGLEFKAAAESAVRAVAPGRILHAGKMPGYETIVIVDHGERYYSLYGRLGGVAVERGAEIAAGAEVGRTSEPDDQGRNFYFEIRRNGEPVDPRLYLKR